MSATAFRGELVLGDAWRDRDFSGLRVALLAPGHDAATVLPAVARSAAAVKVFQESPDWILPIEFPLPHRLAVGLARLHLRAGVADPWTRRLLTPHRRFDRRRPQPGPDFYAALEQPHCKLLAWPVYEIVADGVRTAEGIEHRADCLVVTAASHFAVDPGVVTPREELRA